MKKLFSLSLLITLLSCISYAQDASPNESKAVRVKNHPSKVYFDLSTGINAPGSALGLGADFHVDPNVSIDAGVGLVSSWGNKLYAGGKYFLNADHKGSALSAGVTYNTGIADFQLRMETRYGTRERVQLDLLPQVNAFIAWYRYWQMGKHNNRFYFTAGYSIPTTIHKFKQTSGDPISNNSANALKRYFAPGGLMAGIGFSFGNR